MDDDTARQERGESADGAVADGAVADGAVADGAVADGVAADGVAADGVAADGAVADGVAADGAVADGVAAGGLLPAGDLRSLRMFRATAKAAGGVLDLVMPMRVGDGAPALFFAHPMIGLSWCYLALLPHIDARYPLYGVQARGLRRPEPLPVTMAEMAQDYADQIRMVQPSGPYHLFGWSLGGNIAFAIAEELERRGERIGLLVMLDSNLAAIDAVAPSNPPWMIYNIVLSQFGYVPALTPGDPDPGARMLELVRRRPGLGLDDWPERRIHALQRVIGNNVAIANTHKPGLVHCRLLFFSAAHNPPALAEKVEIWRSFVDGPIEAIELDCDHRHMLLPEPAAVIGPALTEELARAAVAGTAPIVLPSLPHLALWRDIRLMF